MVMAKFGPTAFSIQRSMDINKFYKHKNIINQFNFYVYLDFPTINKPAEFALSEKGTNFLGDGVEPYKVVSVDIPNHSFSRESVNYGATQYSYPVLDAEQGLDINIIFDEDIYGNIGSFINDLKRTVVRDGLHVAPKNSRLGDIHIYLMDNTKSIVHHYIAKDVFFLGAEAISLDYASNESVRYNIKFGTDYLVYNYDTNTITDVKNKIARRIARIY